MCEFTSQSYTYVSWSSPLTLSFRNLRRASMNRIDAYAYKGNFIRSKRERSFLRNSFLVSEFISQTYNLDLRKQFANTLFVETAKWYLGTHRGQWWKGKYPHIITKEKLSQRLLSDVWLHHTEFHLSLLGTVSDTVVVDFAMWYLGAHRSPWWKRKYPHIVRREKLSERSAKWYFGYFLEQWSIRWQRKYPKMETRKKHS